MGLRVLFVDDEAHIRKAVSAFLERRGFDILTAEDGEEAMRGIIERAPDVVVTDVMMPKMDGYELTRALRENPATAGIPILILSARKEDAAMLQGYESGADEYVPKPVQLSVLAAKIEAIARRQAPSASAVRGVGKIVTFVHAKGGVGATTVLVNAAASSERTPSRTFIVDASLPMGDVSLLLDLDARRSLASLTDHAPESVDPRVVVDAASTRGNMSVLAAPDSPMRIG